MIAGHEEQLEDLSRRFKLPYISEYELSFFRKLFHPELAAALAKTEPCAERGRLRRLMGDLSGAAEDFKAALDADPACARAYLWLGELDLAGPAAEANLTRAIELEGKLSWGYLYRGAARLLAGDQGGALADLETFARERPAAGLGRLLAGLAHERAGAPRRAAAHYRAAVKANPGCSAAHLLLARAAKSPRACERALDADPIYALITLSKYQPGRSWEKHLSWLNDFAFAEPERAGWYYRQDDIHYSPYQLEEFSDSVRLSRFRPKAAWALGLVGRGAFRSPPDAARLKAGADALKKAVQLSPLSGWAYAWRGLSKLKTGDMAGALADIDRCIHLQPYYHRAYAWRGGLLRKLGRVKEALADMDRALAIDEEYSFVVHERSLARRALGDWAGAASDMDRAFRLDWRYTWVFTVGRAPEARELAAGVAELDRALAARPRLASLWVWRGQLHLQRREFSQTYGDFEQAIHLDPHHALAHGWYGRALLEEGRFADAEVMLARAAALEPSLTVFQGWLARAAPKKALGILDGVIKAKPELWWAYHQRASRLLDAGRPRRALPDLKKSLELAGRRVENHYLAARVRLALSDLAGAEVEVGRALTISPRFGRAYLLRAQIRQRQGRHDDVLADYRTVYEKFPYLFNDEERLRVQALLKR